jgi:hypothetical protein
VAALPGAVAYGFNLSFWSVCALFIIAFLYVFFRKNRHWNFLIWTGFLFLFALIVYNRYFDLNKNEVCIYNSTVPVISIKIGKDIFCFYNGDNKTREKANLLLTSYQKYHPGFIHFYSINEKNYFIKMESHQIASQKSKGKVILTVDQYVLDISLKKEKWIDEIYLSNSTNKLAIAKLDFSEGAKRIPLN